MNVYLLTPIEAERIHDEYKRYFADGPPYNPSVSPNAAKLRERDNRMLEALRRRSS